VLIGDQEFTAEGAVGGAAAQGLLGGDADHVRIVVFEGDVGQDQETGQSVEAFGIGKVFAHGVIREMAGAAEDALLYDPWIRSNFQHIQVVIGFKEQAIRIAQVNFYQLGEIAQVRDQRHFCAIRFEGESQRVGRVVRDGEGVHIDVTDGEALASMYGFDAAQPLAKSFREATAEGFHGRLGDKKRSFPEPQHLWKPVAVIGMLVSDQDAVERFHGDIEGGEAGKRFAFTEAGIHEESGARGLEEGDVPRAARGQNGDAQADRFLSLASV